MGNQRNFLEEVKKKLNIKEPSDWGKITIKDMRKVGGGSLLTGYYKGSILACLRSVYKGISFSFVLKDEWN